LNSIIAFGFGRNMKLKSTLFSTIGMLCAMTAMAGSRWQGPGWYQVVEKAQPGHGSESVIYQPTAFASREECQATLPRDRLASGHDEHRLDTFYDFSCVELQGRPDWDR
jgi:hypothetical protein